MYLLQFVFLLLLFRDEKKINKLIKKYNTQREKKGERQKQTNRKKTKKKLHKKYNILQKHRNTPDIRIQGRDVYKSEGVKY